MLQTPFDTAAQDFHLQWYLADWRQKRRDQILNNLNTFTSKPGLDICDIGCGNGEYSANIWRKANSICLIDSSSQMLALAKQRFGRLGTLNNKFSFVCNDMCKLQDLPSNHFDLALCHNTIGYITDPASGIRQLSRIIKPDGVISLVFPNLSQKFIRFVSEDKIDKAFRLLEKPYVHISEFNVLERCFLTDEIENMARESFLKIESRFDVQVYTSDIISDRHSWNAINSLRRRDGWLLVKDKRIVVPSFIQYILSK